MKTIALNFDIFLFDDACRHAMLFARLITFLIHISLIISFRLPITPFIYITLMCSLQLNESFRDLMCEYN